MEFDKLYEKASDLWAMGHDEIYIGNQLAEEGVDDNLIDKVIDKIKNLEKSERRKSGLKFIIYGLSFIVAGIGLTWLSTNWEFEYGFVFWGLPILGVMTTLRGIGRIIGI